ncbi:MAG: glycosyltransferase family 2 protein [Parcubacteria group bacterium]|jgi:hypothetical protein
MNPSHKPISFIIVNYHSAIELHKCLFDLAHVPNAHIHEIIIVNNDSTALSLQNFGFLHQKCIEIGKNIGYGAANNIGLTHAKFPFVCFLNPDTHSFCKNFFDIVFHIDEKTIVSPRVNTEDLLPQQWSVGEKITLLHLIKNHIGIHKKPWKFTKKTPVRWVSGAAMCARTQFIRDIGGFDESFFLYFEDVDLCERAHHNDGFVYYIPTISLIHTSGQSSKNTGKIQKKWYYASQDTFFKKHFGACHVLLLRIFRLFYIK